jgi:hypothetical protein
MDGRGRQNWTAAARVATLLVAFGCGARAQVEGAGEGGDGAGALEGEAGAGDARGNGGARSTPLPPDPGGDNLDLRGTTLPACQPGFSPASGGMRECAYMFRGQCYEEKLEACACACVGSAVSRCISGGFLDPDEPQTVSCIAG